MFIETQFVCTFVVFFVLIVLQDVLEQFGISLRLCANEDERDEAGGGQDSADEDMLETVDQDDQVGLILTVKTFERKKNALRVETFSAFFSARTVRNFRLRREQYLNVCDLSLVALLPIFKQWRTGKTSSEVVNI